MGSLWAKLAPSRNEAEPEILPSTEETMCIDPSPTPPQVEPRFHASLRDPSIDDERTWYTSVATPDDQPSVGMPHEFFSIAWPQYEDRCFQHRHREILLTAGGMPGLNWAAPLDGNYRCMHFVEDVRSPIVRDQEIMARKRGNVQHEKSKASATSKRDATQRRRRRKALEEHEADKEQQRKLDEEREIEESQSLRPIDDPLFVPEPRSKKRRRQQSIEKDEGVVQRRSQRKAPRIDFASIEKAQDLLLKEVVRESTNEKDDDVMVHEGDNIERKTEVPSASQRDEVVEGFHNVVETMPFERTKAEPDSATPSKAISPASPHSSPSEHVEPKQRQCPKKKRVNKKSSASGTGARKRRQIKSESCKVCGCLKPRLRDDDDDICSNCKAAQQKKAKRKSQSDCSSPKAKKRRYIEKTDDAEEEIPSAHTKVVKIKRAMTSPEHAAALEKAFRKTRWPSRLERIQLSQQFDWTPRKVQVWFQNRRQRENRMQEELATENRIREQLAGAKREKERKVDHDETKRKSLENDGKQKGKKKKNTREKDGKMKKAKGKGKEHIKAKK